MCSSHRSLVVGTASVLVVFAFIIAISETRNPDVWYGVGAAYSLTLLLTGGIWYWRGRSLGFSETAVVAAVVVVILFPLTPRLFVVGNTSLSLLPGWSLLPFHLQRFVPIAFMLPLGAATTQGERFATIITILLPALYRLFDWFALHPDRFNPFWTTPLNLVVGTGGWFVFYVAVGGPLFLLGRHLVRENGRFLDTVGLARAPETG